MKKKWIGILGFFIAFTAVCQTSAQPPEQARPARGPVTQRANSGVNLNNGNFYTTYTDFSFLNDPMPIVLTRTYNARSNYEGLFGLGWSSNLDTLLEFLPDGSIILREGGGGRTEVYVAQREATGLAGIVNALIEKIKAQDPGKTSVYYDNLKKQATEDEFLRRRLFRRYYPSTPEHLSGSRWVHRSVEGEWIERTPAGHFRQIGVNMPMRTFDAKGNMLRIEDPLTKSVWNFQWRDNRLNSISDNAGHVVQFTYTNENLIQRVVFTAPQKTQVVAAYKYVKQGNVHLLEAVRDAYDNLVTHQYTARGDIVQIKYHDDTQETIRYDPRNNWVAQYTKWDGTSAVYSYAVDSANPLHQAISVKYLTPDGKPLRPEEKFTYLYERQRGGSLVLASLEEEIGGMRQKTVYNESNMPILIEAAGIKVSMKYDNLGRLVEKKGPDELVKYTYQGNNRHPATVDRNGKVYRYSYANALVTAAEGPEGKIQVTYDSVGRVSAIANQTKNTRLSFVYNEFGIPTKITRAGYGEINFKYSNTGQLIDLVSKPLRNDISPIMVANGVTQSFRDFLVLLLPTGQNPVVDVTFEISVIDQHRRVL